MPALKKSALHSAMVLTASSIGLQLLGFAYRVFLGRVTGAEGMGVVQLVMPVYSVLISLTFSGLCTAVTNISSEQNATHDSAGMRRLVGTSSRVFVVLFLAAAVPLALSSGWISKTVLGDGETRLALLIMLPCLFLTGFENIYKSWFYGIKDVKMPAVSDQLEQVVRIGAVAALLLAFPPESPAMAAALIVAGMTVSELFSSVFLAVRYRLSRPPAPAGAAVGSAGKGMLRRILAVAVPVSASGLAGNLLSSVNTVIVPQRLMAAGWPQGEAVGALGVALGMATPLFLLPMAFVGPLIMVMLPRLSESAATGNMEDVRRKMGKALYATGLLALPAVAVLAPIGPPVCKMLYGLDLPHGYFLLLAAGMLPWYYQIITAGMLNGTGRQTQAMVNTILGDVLQLAVTWFAAADPKLGIYGFLWGMLAGPVLSAGLNMACLISGAGFKVQWTRWIVLPWLAAAAAGLVCWNVYSLGKSFGWADVPSMAWAFAAGVLSALLCLKIQGVRIGGYIRQLLPKGRVSAQSYGFTSFYF